MQYRKLIEKRRSVRKFLMGKKPDWRKILQAIDCARFIPSPGNQYNFHFILVSDKNLIEQIAQACQQEFVSHGDYVVVCVSDPGALERLYGERANKYNSQQAGAAIENFLLALTDLGLATTWVGHFYEEMIKRVLEIPDKFTVEAVFPIGLEAKNISKKTKIKADLENIVYFDKWANIYMKPKNIITSDAA
ncbi:MAG: nitroreductase family protein [Nanoarchaeota archaeon]|nr:nitroreductase family protein [Nanoarchaeota archaeon]